MRIIISGGSGVIGRALTANLTADKHEVIILTRNPQSVTDLPSGARAVQWDGRTAAGWAQYADGADALVNFAGESIAGHNPIFDHWTPERKKLIINSRLEAGQAMIEAIKAAKIKPRVLVQASAVGYYGACGDEEVTEQHPNGNDFQADVCRQWEAATDEADNLGVRRVIIRTGLVLAKKGGFLTPLLIIWKLMAGGPFGNGQHWWPWIHMDDEIGAIRFLIDNASAQGPFNLSAPNPVRMSEFGKTLGRVLHRPYLIPTPAFALRLMMGELADGLLLSGQRQVPTHLEQLGYKFKSPTLEPALRDILK
jgi:uncharacterized protein